jgi:dihydroxy-acid dehydratase
MTDYASKSGSARNTANYGDKDFALYLRWSFGKSMGLLAGDARSAGGGDCRYRFGGRQLPPHGAGVDRGGEAGRAGRRGVPMPFPTVSLCEPSLFPTSMHLAALDAEAMLTAQPMAIGRRQGSTTCDVSGDRAVPEGESVVQLV